MIPGSGAGNVVDLSTFGWYERNLSSETVTYSEHSFGERFLLLSYLSVGEKELYFAGEERSVLINCRILQL